MSSRLQDQGIVVTGAAAGLGRAIADDLIAQGARVHVCDLDAAALESFAKERPEVGISVVDIGDPAAVDQLFADARKSLGTITGLVNNVGIAGPIGPAESVDLAHWRRAIDVNLTGTFVCTQHAIPLLKADGGSIVNMSSVAGRAGFPERASYCSTKAALLGLTRSLALELGPLNIRVNAVLPGAVESERLETVLQARAKNEQRPYADLRREAENTCALKRTISPEEVAGTVAFLMSGSASGITGQAISICGGAKI